MNLLQVGLSLIGVLGLIFMLFYALKKFNKRVSASGGNKMRVIDRVNLGRDGMLLVVSAGGKLLLIGVTPQNISLLTELQLSEEDYIRQSPGGQPAPDSVTFKNALENILRGNKKDSDNNDDK